MFRKPTVTQPARALQAASTICSTTRVDSRFNEEATGKLHFGVGVVTGKVPGSGVALPTSASTADNFEGVVINGFDRQQDLEGKLYVLNNQNVGVMRRGRIWVRLATSTAPAYGDALHMIVEGDEAGCFAKEGGIAISRSLHRCGQQWRCAGGAVRRSCRKRR